MMLKLLLTKSKLYLYLTLPCLAIVFNSCSVYYGTGNLGGQYSHEPITFSEKDTSHFHVSGKYNEDATYYPDESNRSGEVSFSWSGSSNKILVGSLGGYVFLGNYSAKNFIKEFAEQNKNYLYYGGGLRLKGGINVPFSSHVHWRVVNAQLAFFLEGGDFSQAKIDGFNLPDSELKKAIQKFYEVNFFKNMAGFMESELAFKFDKNWRGDLYFGLGIIGFVTTTTFLGMTAYYRNYGIGLTYQSLVHQNIKFNNSFMINPALDFGNSFQLAFIYSF